MTGRIEDRLAELGFELPEAQDPIVSKIVGATLANGFLFVSGQIPQWNGELRYVGKLGREFSLADGREAAKLSILNVLAQAKRTLDGDLDRIERVMKLKGYVNSVPDFPDIPLVVNGASEIINDLFGDAGRHARTAIGVTEMPLGVAIEMEATFLVG